MSVAKRTLEGFIARVATETGYDEGDLMGLYMESFFGRPADFYDFVADHHVCARSRPGGVRDVDLTCCTKETLDDLKTIPEKELEELSLSICGAVIGNGLSFRQAEAMLDFAKDRLKDMLTDL